MQSLRTDNERLHLEQEKIMKSLSDRQNQRNRNHSQEKENRTESHRQQDECLVFEGGQTGNEEESNNVSVRRG